MRIIGLTGRSGVGKTTISEILKKEYDAEVINADKVSKELLSNTESEYYQKVVELFGKEILEANNQINRKILADIIFAHPDVKKRNELKQELDNLTFEYVVKEINLEIESILRKKGVSYIVVDAPLLIESKKLLSSCDFVVSILADDKLEIERICARDNIDEKSAKERLNAQNPKQFYIENSDYVIYNETSIDYLKKEVDKMIENFKK